jgi:site-specific DNA-methyltransferase (cytosine-N4-specific)
MTANNNRSSKVLRFSKAQIERFATQAKSLGYRSPEDYLSYLHQKQLSAQSKGLEIKPRKIKRLKVVHRTKIGEILHGNSLDWLHDPKNLSCVDLIVTSPPFGLNTKKPYGNESSGEYLDWFRAFAEGFKKVLKPRGSLVIDIAGSWQKGLPVRSLYHFDVLSLFVRDYGFYLCQEHYWWNTARLPSPAQWVTVERSRVKDAINCAWWLSKSPTPQADNKKVLVEYSDRMKSLLRNSGQSEALRPSGHRITAKFKKDNGGSIPPNILAIGNTESSGPYWEYCRQYGYKIHPARFPQLIPEYFIRFLTKPGDLVLDPFGGSSVTGYVAQHLDRQWVTVETNLEYAKGGKGRFKTHEPFNPWSGFVSR